MADNDDIPKKPGLLRRAVGRTVGAALHGTGSLGQSIESAISGKPTRARRVSGDDRRAPPGIHRRIAGSLAGAALHGTGSFGVAVASTIRGKGSKIPGMSNRQAKPEAKPTDSPELQDVATKVANDINELRSDVIEGMGFLYNEIKTQEQAINQLRRQINKKDPNASTKRLAQQRDASGRYTNKFVDPDQAFKGSGSSAAPTSGSVESLIKKFLPALLAEAVGSGGAMAGGAAAVGSGLLAAGAGRRLLMRGAEGVGRLGGSAVRNLGPIGAVGGATYWARKSNAEKDDLYNENVKKLGKSKADELKKVQNGGITGWLNNRLDDAYSKWKGDDAKPEPKKKTEKPVADLSDGIDIDTKKDISFVTTADIKMKASEIVLDAAKITLKGALTINGKSIDGGDSLSGGIGGSGSSRSPVQQQTYDQDVGKYGQQKASELEDVRNSPGGGAARSLMRQMGISAPSPDGGPASDGSRGPSSAGGQPVVNRNPRMQSLNQISPNTPVETSGERAGLNKNSQLVDAQGSGAKEALGINNRQWNAYRESLAGIESSGGKYDLKGGASNRFSGAYQFGAQEISDTAKQLGEKPPTRDEFLADKGMQERYLDRYTQSHHEYLMKNSPEYQQMGAEQKLGVLGYAHNQGAGGAAKYLRTGEAGSDAFGTSGTKYSKAISQQLAATKNDPSSTGDGKAGLAAVLQSDRKPSELAVDKALKLEGMNERDDRDAIKQYLKTGGVNMDPKTTAWCAATVNSSLAQAGIKGTGSDVANSFQRWGVPVTDAVRKGDVLLQTHGHGPDEVGGHVGFATGETNKQGQVEMYAGNTHDMAKRFWVDPDSVMARRAGPNELPPPPSQQKDEAKKTEVASQDQPKTTPYTPAQPASFKVGEGRIAGHIDENGKLSSMATSFGRSQIIQGFGSNFDKLPKDVQDHLKNASQIDMNKLAPHASLMPDEMRQNLEKEGLSFTDAKPESGGMPIGPPAPPKQDAIKAEAAKVAETATAPQPDAKPAEKSMSDALGAADLDKQQADAQATEAAGSQKMAADLGAGDLDKQQSQADAQVVDKIPRPPEVDNQPSGEEVTANVKGDSDAGTTSSGKEDKVASSGGVKSSGSSSSSGSLRSPTNHPESEGPSPGSDGYGDQTCNPDGGGLCAV